MEKPPGFIVHEAWWPCRLGGVEHQVQLIYKTWRVVVKAHAPMGSNLPPDESLYVVAEGTWDKAQSKLVDRKSLTLSSSDLDRVEALLREKLKEEQAAQN